MENQGPGLLACDEELFARVWDRVTASGAPQAGSVVLNPPEPAPSAPQTALLPVSPPPADLPSPVDPTGAALQRWTLCLLTDSAAYRALARQARQGRDILHSLAREKHHQAKSLAAEYFLRTGVRYWPTGSLSSPPAPPFLPALRWLYTTERRREEALRAQAAQEEAELAQRYLVLSDAARAAALRLRELLEQTW